MRNSALSQKSAWTQRALLVLPLLALLLLSAAPASAAGDRHPAPSVIHDYTMRVNPDSATVTLRFMVSPQLVPQFYRVVDKNLDAVTSDDEQTQWLNAYIKGVSFELDGNPVPFTVTGAGKMTREALLLSMSKSVTVTMQLAYPAVEPSSDANPVEHHVKITDSTNYIGYDEYYATFKDGPGVTVTTHDTISPTNPAIFDATFEADLSAVPSTVEPDAPPAAVPGQDPLADKLLEQFAAFLQDPSANVNFALFIFLLAVGVGALHALSPGHGKTVVAAYLVGTRGRVRDAVVLGIVVTVTHTSSVVILGLVLLLANNFAMPRYFQPLLQVFSGLLIVMLGLWLLVARWRESRAQTAPLVQAPTLAFATAGASAGSAVHSHSAGASHSHSGLEHNHSHTHSGPDHSHEVPANLGFRSLIALGISGGLIPCPDALGIMLLAVWVGQVGIGLALVTSFSIGLAVTLIVIGILMVKAKGILEKLLPGGPNGNPTWVSWLPVISAAIVTVLGVYLMISAVLGQKWS